MSRTFRILNHDITFAFSRRAKRWRWPRYITRRERGWRGPIVMRQIVGLGFSFSIDQEFLCEIEVCRGCASEVQRLGEDGISFCPECEHIVEGDTEIITIEEQERRLR